MATPATKQRVLDATAHLVRRQGYAATGLKEIAAASGARWSSLYHFFPDGKEQLVAESLVLAGRRYEGVIRRLFGEAEDAAAGARAFFLLSADALERSDFADGCPVATAALEAASTSDRLRGAAAEVFEFWTNEAAARIEADGVEAVRARAIATFALAAFEGAILLARTSRSTAPLVDGGAMIERSIRVLAAEPGTGPS